ncbi:MAG: YqgE/AlgH family protein [Pseudomonadales bacterium]|nr:YqgE/AlgH family protein [Pseudomonadales bacterium]
MSELQSFKNQFLISLPTLAGDYFHSTISLLIEHNEQGAFGLVINQPLDIEITNIFPQLDGRYICPVLEGGPVERERVFFLHPGGTEFDSTLSLSDEICLTTSPDIITAMKSATAPENTLACLGYAGWSAGQLEDEIARDVWLLAPASASILFDEPYETRASLAAQQLGIDLNLINPHPGHD